jgi:hypothetical protein
LGWELTVLVFLQRVTLKNHSTGEEKILFLSSEQEKDKTHFTDQVGSIFLWFLTGNVLLKKGISLHRSVVDPLSLNNGSGRILILAGHICGLLAVEKFS